MHLVISEIFPFRWFDPNGRALLLRNTLDASAARRLRTARSCPLMFQLNFRIADVSVGLGQATLPFTRAAAAL